ncbi:hypothetical protein SAMN05216581_1877 [Pseudomonas asplenii]|uniref:Uncharacterized protein n=1 Tax=Pseudomonas asplenii TaxID=53407 RepID=A0A1H6N0K0_9PSED|nr:hypothetical protein SAMN05216581_1877 [Pseudomonas fuscovaginae]
MPQICQIIGVNSVTNIELDKGDMPAPIIRNACWFENFSQRSSLIGHPKPVWRRKAVHLHMLRGDLAFCLYC